VNGFTPAHWALLAELLAEGHPPERVIICFDNDDAGNTAAAKLGKGKKDRMIPIGERALAWIDKYVTGVRPSLVREPDDGALFLTNLNEPFTPNRLTQMVREYVDAAQLGKRGACHLFRHTMATLMLENGADIRFIQQMLGHAELSTTQIYTQVSIRKLKEIHTLTHPAKLEKPTTPATPAMADAIASVDAAKAELLSSLAAEAADKEPAG